VRPALLILGAGGHGRVVADAARQAGYERIGMLDDRFPEVETSGPFAIVGKMAQLGEFLADYENAVAAVGDAHLRLELLDRLGAAGYRLPAVIHPSAVGSAGAALDRGVFVGPGAIVNIGADIGAATIVNSGARIDHDCRVGPGCHIAPGAVLSGSVTLGDRVWIGTGACLRQGVTIGSMATIGVGAAVVSDLPGNTTYVGVPARRLR
jgi:sugar O-acyltransferase (sialic acid O-acetyltransferase NeuD family)